ncbi:MAG: DUF4493 domain-containing protein [Bacteroidetes bacterium]|nr:DUF4493 domain-containing protein [Bacteroidota bacterium]
MTIKDLKFLVFFISISLMASCEKTNIQDNKETGEINLNISKPKLNSDVIISKASSKFKVPLITDLIIELKNNNEEIAYKEKATSSILKIKLDEGTYKLRTFFGEEQNVGTTPYWEGTENINIKKYNITKSNIICSLANSAVEIIYSSELTEYFDSYKVTISNNNENLNFASKENYNRAFFKRNTLTNIVFEGIKSGLTTTKILGTLNSSGNQIFKYNLSIKGKEQKITIDVDRSIETVSISTTIPNEWIPKPKIAETKSLDFVETYFPTEINFDVESPFEIEDITLTFDDREDNISLKGENNLRDKGISWNDDIFDTKKGVISFNDFIKQAPLGISCVTIKVIDKFQNEVSSNLNIKKDKLTLNFSELSSDKSEIWAKKIDCLTLETNGDINDFSSIKLFINDNIWDNFSLKNGKIIVNDLLPNTAYNIRIEGDKEAIKNLSTSKLSVKTENASQVKNGNMEEWKNNKVKIGWCFKSFYLYYYESWKSGESDKWWDTNNSRTTDNRQWDIVYGYNSFSAVSYTYDKHSGNKAAEIRTTNAIMGNTVDITYEKGKNRGKLFIGNYLKKDKRDNDVTNMGHNFNSRPTSVSYWYKYSPYGSDSYDMGVIVKSGETVIGEAKHISPNSINEYTLETVPIEYTIKNMKATSLGIYFYSSNKADNKVEHRKIEIDLADGGNGWNTHTGSILKIDDVLLNY